MTDSDRLELMNVTEVARRCQDETQRFYRREPHDDHPCLELFRRALTLKNHFAWEAICKTYNNQVRGWIRRSGHYESLDHPLEELVAMSFERFWQATFRQVAYDAFHSLEAILSYLHACCTSVIIDLL
ncbi:MAG: sigma-70 family RNA polymerase sigma factor, partial [Ardenticatenaceae bacterium]